MIAIQMVCSDEELVLGADYLARLTGRKAYRVVYPQVVKGSLFHPNGEPRKTANYRDCSFYEEHSSSPIHWCDIAELGRIL